MEIWPQAAEPFRVKLDAALRVVAPQHDIDAEALEAVVEEVLDGVITGQDPAHLADLTPRNTAWFQQAAVNLLQCRRAGGAGVRGGLRG